MNTIKSYLDNMFAGLPKTKEVTKMKEDLLLNMEDKYFELKKEGKSENEAIGIVISEFGNIEELAEELGIDITVDRETPTVVTDEMATDFMIASKKYGFFIALGVSLLVLSPALLIFMSRKEGLDRLLSVTEANILGFVVMIVLIASAVGLLIFGGMNISKFEYLKKDIQVPARIQEQVRKEKRAFDPRFTGGLIVSIMMFILSPVMLVIYSLLNESLGENKYHLTDGVVLLLVVVALGIFILIRLGMIKSSHDVLLQIEEYSKEEKKSSKIISTIAGIYWPIVIAGYLLWSFIGGDWSTSWLIWPIAGVLFGGLSSVIESTAKDKK